MTQYYVDLNKAKSIIDNAPTIKTIRYNIKSYGVLVELFDFGYPMWGKTICPEGTNIKGRFFFNGVRVELYSSPSLENGRYSWFPKNITRKLWNEKLLENGFDIYGGVNARS